MDTKEQEVTRKDKVEAEELKQRFTPVDRSQFFIEHQETEDEKGRKIFLPRMMFHVTARPDYWDSSDLSVNIIFPLQTSRIDGVMKEALKKALENTLSLALLQTAIEVHSVIDGAYVKPKEEVKK